MIPKKNRFIRSRTIERIYKTVRPVRNGPFSIRVKKSRAEEYRLAVVVSKKVNKSAVIRNRIRRRIFEYIRKTLPEDRLKGREIILTVFDETTATTSFDELDKQLKKLFKKAGI